MTDGITVRETQKVSFHLLTDVDEGAKLNIIKYYINLKHLFLKCLWDVIKNVNLW